jgi:hypothetical protein
MRGFRVAGALEGAASVRVAVAAARKSVLEKRMVKRLKSAGLSSIEMIKLREVLEQSSASTSHPLYMPSTALPSDEAVGTGAVALEGSLQGHESV